jgi:branched-chain amino acid transport system permease protein
VITATVAVILGSVTLKLSGHFLPLGTMAWGISLYFLFGNMEFLGGHGGLSGIPPVSLFGYELVTTGSSTTCLGFVLAALFTTRNLLDSREGRAIRALKGGMVMAEAMGVDTSRRAW